MESILNIFLKPDLEKTNTKNDQTKNIVFNSETCEPSSPEHFPSLNQGISFHNYQDKIISRLEEKIENVNSKEGFQNTSSNYKKEEYKNTLNEYNNLLNTIATNINQFVARSSPNNPYANKILNWTDPDANGMKMYITSKGVARPIKSKEVYNSLLGKNGCPSVNNVMDITLKWDSSYIIPGTTIPTNPSLYVGSEMQIGESCGLEGSNIYVNRLVGDLNSKYRGCYADKPDNPVMKFIGNRPPPENFIQNGNFNIPALRNNTFKGYTNSYEIPGWFMTAVLANNSSAWGFPMPYPAGNQCIVLQKTNELTTLDLDLQKTSSYTLSFMSCGRNCCDRSGQSNPIDIFVGGNKIYSFTAPVNKWTTYSTTFSPPASGNQKITFKGTWTSSDRSSALQNIYLGIAGGSSAGDYTYDMCQESAVDGQYKYFGLQNVNKSTGKGYCAVSNDFVSASSLGTSFVVTGGVKLWSTNTATIGGSTAQLTELGQLVVLNSSNSIIYETTNNTNKRENGGSFQGCFTDRPNRAMTWLDRPKYMTPDKCKDLAVQNKFKFYGLQDSQRGRENINACFGSNDFNAATKYGKSSNCRVVNGLTSGGPWANAIYSLEPGANYFLILQNDGNMVIYKGTSPADNQGAIWSSQTNGKQRRPNPRYEAKKGKYGRNWIKNGDILAKGDFVGSENGNIYLEMGNDGNLTLYTSDNNINCMNIGNNLNGGGVGANAIYEITRVGNPNSLTDVGYVDIDSTIYSFPETNISFGNTYTEFKNSDNPGNDIPNAAITNSNLDACKSKCNTTKDCQGFVFNTQTNTCYPKGGGIYPKSQRTILNSNIANLYVRDKVVSQVEGMETMKNIDTIRYDNYKNSDKTVKDRKKVADMVMTTTQKQQLEQIYSRLNLLAKEISDLTISDQNEINKITKEIEQNNKLLYSKVDDYNLMDNYSNVKNLYNFLGTEDRNLENMLKDSNLNVLHENYNYILWTSLALGTLLITLNVVK